MREARQVHRRWGAINVAIALVSVWLVGLGGVGVTAAETAHGWLAGAPLGRIWGAPGDSLIAGTQVTLGFRLLDVTGRADRLAEHDGLVDSDGGWARIDHTTWFGERSFVTARGWLRSDDRAPGGLWLRTGWLGEAVLEARYDRWLHYDRRDASDLYLAPGLPREAMAEPRTRWDMLGVTYKRRLSPGVNARVGYEYGQQSGNRPSLGRGEVAAPHEFGPPAVSAREVWRHRLFTGGDLGAGRFAVDWAVDYQRDEGQRMRRVDWLANGLPLRDTHGIADSRDAWNVRVGSTYAASARLLLFGNYGFLKRTSEPVESWHAASPLQADQTILSDQTEVDVRMHTALAGALYRPRPWLRLKAALRHQQLNQEGVATLARPDPGFVSSRHALEKERVRQVLSFDGQHTGWRRTAIDARYRLERADETANSVTLDEFLDGNIIVRGQAGERERTRHDLGFKLRHRTAPWLTWTERFSYRRETIDQQDALAGGYYAQGDRSWERSRWEFGARVRLSGVLLFDTGYEGLREEFEREDLAGAKTEWDADRFFANASWLPDPRLSIFTAFAIGEEVYRVDATLPAIFDNALVTNPIAYDGTTYRLAPGISLRPADLWELEGHYERVRNRDSIANDHDRWYGRAACRLTPRLSVSAYYRNYEFLSRQLGGGYTADLYGLSATARF